MPDAESSNQLSAEDVRRLCGDILDWKVEAILELQPSAGDVAAAVGWSSGQDDLGQEGRPLTGVAAQVYDVLTADEFAERERE